MVWQPAGYDGSCNGNSTNQSASLTLICFLMQYFSKSNDEILKDIYAEPNVNENEYDFIIVGAGAAGCVVANRLTEESNWKVLLLEAGDEEPLVSEVPGLYSYLQNSNIDYSYRSNDSIPRTYNRGKAMGGSTTINGMFYARGSKADYNDWANSGNDGWSWEDVLPYFKKSENARDPEIISNYPEYHGMDGYLTIEQYAVVDKSTPLFIDAFIEAGLNKTDYNKGDQIGVSHRQSTIVHGARLSGNGAFIRPIRGKRSNLVVKLNSRVTRIIINAETKRATGVEYQTINENGTVTVQVSASKEVIISAGVIDSPKLLMLSGIGPKSHLNQLNITVVKDLSVGLSLYDHCLVNLQLRSNSTPVSAGDTSKADLFEWINTHESSVSTGLSVVGFYQTKFENKSGAADIQYDIYGGTQVDNTLGNYSVQVSIVKPKSVGYLKLNSIDPINYQPDFQLNHLGDPQDVEVLVEGIKFVRNLSTTQTMKNAGLTLSAITATGCEDIDVNSDDYLRCFINNTVENSLHGVGTCKMGPETDKNAVVDKTLKVYGITGLRVIDASIMPNIVRGNTMAATYMIAEKGSDMIKQDHM